MHRYLQTGLARKRALKGKKQTQKSRCFQQLLWLMESAEGRAKAPQRLGFFDRLRRDCGKRVGLRRRGDDFRNALAGFKRTGAVEVSALVIALLHQLGHIAARFGVRRAFAVRAVHHFFLPSLNTFRNHKAYLITFLTRFRQGKKRIST